jgi:hypothetical protein
MHRQVPPTRQHAPVRRIILTVNQIRALNAIARRNNMPLRYSEESASNSVVSKTGVPHELSKTNVTDRHYRRLMRELEDNGFVAQADVPISVFQEPDTTTNQPGAAGDDAASTSSSSDSSIADDQQENNADDDEDNEDRASSSIRTSSSSSIRISSSNDEDSSSRNKSRTSSSNEGSDASSSSSDSSSDDEDYANLQRYIT